MKFNHLFFRLSNLSMPVVLGSLIVSCAGIQTPSNDVVVSDSPSPVSSASDTSEELIFLNDQRDLVNIDKLLLQVNRANQTTKKLASGLLEDGKRLAKQDRKEGLHGQRSGLPKLFCGSAVSYPTVDALTGCAESLVIHDGGFDVKVGNMRLASDIYRATLEFGDRTNKPISGAERQKILDNIKCLDAFVKTPDPKSPGCELIRISLKKA
jgi:hypothetical protein